MKSRPADREQAAIQRAFVAVGYALGQREPKLLARLLEPGNASRHLADSLSHRDRRQRVRTLAADLKPIVEALDKLRVTCR